jgi:hypothetical protein
MSAPDTAPVGGGCYTLQQLLTWAERKDRRDAQQAREPQFRIGTVTELLNRAYAASLSAEQPPDHVPGYAELRTLSYSRYGGELNFPRLNQMVAEIMSACAMSVDDVLGMSPHQAASALQVHGARRECGEWTLRKLLHWAEEQNRRATARRPAVRGGRGQLLQFSRDEYAACLDYLRSNEPEVYAALPPAVTELDTLFGTLTKSDAALELVYRFIPGPDLAAGYQDLRTLALRVYRDDLLPATIRAIAAAVSQAADMSEASSWGLGLDQACRLHPPIPGGSGGKPNRKGFGGRPRKQAPEWSALLRLLLKTKRWEGWREHYHQRTLDYDALAGAVNETWEGKRATAKALQTYFKTTEGQTLLNDKDGKLNRR